jgi:membrane protein implicated in regulation of membrane protease activity
MEWPGWLQDWQAWLALSIALGVAEVFSLDLVLLMLAAGGVVGMLAALLGAPLVLQVLLAIAASVAMLAVVRRVWYAASTPARSCAWGTRRWSAGRRSWSTKCRCTEGRSA